MFIGAGSVVFTQGLLADLLALPRAARRPASPCTTSTPSGWHRRGRRPPHRRRARRPPADHRPRSTAGTPSTAPTSSSTSIQVGMARRHRHRLRDPRPVRPAPDDRRHPRRRRHLPRAAHVPACSTALAADIAAVCPDALAAQLHQPDGDERLVPRRATGLTQRGRAVPLGLLDHARPVRAGGACRTRRSPTWRRASTTRRGCCGSSATARTSTRGSTRPIAARPAAAPPGPGRHVPAAGLLPDRDQRALGRVRARGSCATTARSSGCASPSATTCGISEENVREYEQTRDAVGSRRPSCRSRAPTEYAPQIIHSMVTGTPRAVYGNVANHGLISNLPARLRRRGALPGGRHRRAAHPRRRAAAAVRRAQPRLR